MCTALVAQQQTVALRIVAGVVGPAAYLHQAAVTVVALAGRYTFRHNGRTCVLAHMYHLGAGIGLLVVVRDGHAVELRRRVVALQDAAGVLPCHRTSGFHLCPREFAV